MATIRRFCLPGFFPGSYERMIRASQSGKSNWVTAMKTLAQFQIGFWALGLQAKTQNPALFLVFRLGMKQQSCAPHSHPTPKKNQIF